MLNPKTGSSDMEQYVIKTALVGKPDVVLYFKGTANEDGVSFAMNTIVGFDVSEAKHSGPRRRTGASCARPKPPTAA